MQLHIIYHCYSKADTNGMQRENANDEYGVEMEMEIEYSYKSFKIYHFAETTAVAAVALAAPALPVPIILMRITKLSSHSLAA